MIGRLFIKSLLGLGLLALPLSAMAQSQTTDIRPDAKRLKGDALLDAFIGKTFDGAYNFTDDGEPQRFFTEKHHEDSRAAYTESDVTTQGVWTIMKDALCYRYKSTSMTGGCFRVYKVGNCFYFYDQRLRERPHEIGENYWTARSTVSGEAPNCDPTFT